MKLKPTLILLVVAAVAIGYFFLVEQPRHRSQLADDQRQQRLTDVESADVHTLTLQRPDGTLEFIRANNQWRMTRPVEDRADRGSVNTLVVSVLDAVIERQFAADTLKLSDYGLSEPAATLRFTDSLLTEQLTLEIGDFTLTRTHCYARSRNSDIVLLLPAGLRRYATRKTFDYRDKKVTDLDVAEVTRIDLESGRATLSWRRLSGGGWFTLASGDTIDGDKTAIESILRELRALRAKNLVDDPSVTIDERAGVISVWSKPDSNRTRFVFGSPASGHCFLKVDGRRRVELVEATALDVFARTIDDLRDRHLLHFDPDLLARIVLDADGVSVSLTKHGTEWSFTNPTFGAVDQTAAGNLLSRLSNLKYREIVQERSTNLELYGLDEPFYSISLYNPKNQLIDRIVSGPTQPGPRTRYTTSVTSRHLGTIDAEPLEEIQELFKTIRLQ